MCAGILAAAILLGGCGGGSSGSGEGSGGGGNPPPAADFQLSFDSSSVSIQAGSSGQRNLTATALNGFSGQVSVQISGLPSGVSASPSSATLSPGVAQEFTISVAGSAAATTATVVFTGTSGSLTHSADLHLTITTGTTGDLTTRTRYVRTDAVTEYFTALNDRWVVFNPGTSRFFVTDPFGNKVMVLSSPTETEIGTIAVPGAWNVDDTPDHSKLYVGTLLGDVYAIDPVSMTVTHRYLASEIGPYGYQALSAVVMADGRLALLSEQGGIPSVDGSNGFAIWDPATNAISIYGGPPPSTPGEIPTLPVCGMGNIGAFNRTPDRTAIFLGSIDSDGTVCEINESTGALQSFLPNGSPLHLNFSPDGNYLAFPSYQDGSVVLYNAHTFEQVAEFKIAGETASDANLVFSADSTTLFASGSSIVYAYSVPGGQQIGWLPNIVVQQTSGGFTLSPAANPDYGAFDGTGLLVGPLEEGFGFLDTTLMRTGAVGTQFLNGYLNPPAGPTSSGTPIQLPDPNPVGSLSAMYFGSQPASSVSESSGIISATTPPSNAGPVDVYTFTSDGGMQLIPEGFSYGPTVLEAMPNVSTAEGGATGIIYGYGFGPANATGIPAGLSVSVGGKSAAVTGFTSNAYNALAPPFPLQALAYTIPPGSAGSSANVTVTSTAGATTAVGAFSYLPPTRLFPLSGAQLAQGIYDATRDVYYFSDANKVQVFSRAQGEWLSPITIPAPVGGVPQRLWGLALSPDGSKLAIADIGADVIYLLNPSNPGSVRTFPFAPSLPPGAQANPAGIAIMNSGIAYITGDVLGGDGYDQYYKLDTNTGTLTSLNIVGPGLGPSDSYLRTELSSDGSRVFFNSYGAVFSIDTASGIVTQASSNQGCCYGNYDLALSANQTQLAGSSYLYDTDLNAQSFLTLNDREAENISYVYGMKLSPDGSLLFQPSTNGIDVFDGRTGILRERIALPFDLSANYDAFVEDGQDNVLVAIAGANGDSVAIVDLSSVSEPPPLPYSNQSRSRPRNEDASATAGRVTHDTKMAFPHAVPHATREQRTPAPLTP